MEEIEADVEEGIIDLTDDDDDLDAPDLHLFWFEVIEIDSRISMQAKMLPPCNFPHRRKKIIEIIDLDAIEDTPIAVNPPPTVVTASQTSENIDEERVDSVMQSPSDSGIGRSIETEDELTDGGQTSENDENLTKTDSNIDRTLYIKQSESMIIENDRLMNSNEKSSFSTNIVDNVECFARKFTEVYGDPKICDEVVLNSQRAHIIDAQFVETDPEVSLDGLDEETIVDKAVSAGLVEPTDSRPCRTANENLLENVLNTDGTAFNPDDMVNTEYKRGSCYKSAMTAAAVVASIKMPTSEPETILPPSLVTKTYQNKRKYRTASKSSSPSSIRNPVVIFDPFSTFPTKQIVTGEETGINPSHSHESSGGHVLFSVPLNQKPFPLGQFSGLKTAQQSVSKLQRSRSNSPAVHYSTQLPQNAISNILNDWTKPNGHSNASTQQSDEQTAAVMSITNTAAKTTLKKGPTSSSSVLLLDESSRRSFEKPVKCEHIDRKATTSSVSSVPLINIGENLFSESEEFVNMNKDSDEEERDSMIQERHTYLNKRNLENRSRMFAPQRPLIDQQKLMRMPHIKGKF